MKIFTSNPKDEFTNYQLEIETKVLEVLRSGKYILGNELDKFENSFKEYIGSKYSVGVANGTDALEIAVKALNLKKGSEIIVPANTWISTAEAVVNNGGGTSDGRWVSPSGSEVIELGPINKTIHQIDEKISLEDLEKLQEIYQQILIEINNLIR